MYKKKILITGSSGFVGTQLKKKLITKYNVLSPNSKRLDLLKIK